MMSHGPTSVCLPRHDTRFFFSVSIPQHMRSSLLRESARAMMAIACAIAWTLVVVLIAG